MSELAKTFEPGPIEAHFVEDLRFKGGWADTAIYAILDREWPADAMR